MRKASLAAASAALLALAACSQGNQDQLNDNEINAGATNQSLNDLSDEAANVASEAQALENHAQELNQQAQEAKNTAAPQMPTDENIQGM